MPTQDGGDEQDEYENEYEEIDPLEKEWMLAGAQADMDSLQRLLMTDVTLLNRKGFLHGYTALHWAAKHGRMDILTMLLLQGALPNIKSVSNMRTDTLTHSFVSPQLCAHVCPSIDSVCVGGGGGGGGGGWLPYLFCGQYLAG